MQVSSCSHSFLGHVLHPFCPQSPCAKIARIAFNFFNSFISHTTIKQVPVRPRRPLFILVPTSGQKITPDVLTDISSNRTPDKPYSELGIQALEDSRQLLQKAPDLESIQILSPSASPPPNRAILYLCTLADNVYHPALMKELEKTQSYESQGVKDLIEKLMKISYAISVLTLDDLPSVQKIEQKSLAEVLTNQHSFLYKAFFYLTTYYHRIRGELLLVDGRFVCKNSKEHATKFYQEGTLEYGWRTLYNSWCDRLREYIPDMDLKREDERYLSWSQKDLTIESFTPSPDTLPS